MVNGVAYLAGGLHDRQTFGEVVDLTSEVPGIRRVQSLLHLPDSETIVRRLSGSATSLPALVSTWPVSRPAGHRAGAVFLIGAGPLRSILEVQLDPPAKASLASEFPDRRLACSPVAEIAAEAGEHTV